MGMLWGSFEAEIMYLSSMLMEQLFLPIRNGKGVLNLAREILDFAFCNWKKENDGCKVKCKRSCDASVLLWSILCLVLESGCR